MSSRLANKVETRGSDDVIKAKLPKNDGITDNLPTDGDFLTVSEAEIILLVKKNSGSDMNDLVSHYQNYFDQPKSRTRITEIIKDIFEKQEKHSRIYIERKRSGSYKYSIPTENFVDRLNTALLLLEIAGGYEKLGGGTDDLYIENFKKYISQIYGNSITDIDPCLKQSEDANLIKLIDYQSASGTVIQGVRRLPRLSHDQEYFVLLVTDYLKDLQKKLKEVEQNLGSLKPTQRGFKKKKNESEKQKKVVVQKINHIGKLVELFKPKPINN